MKNNLIQQAALVATVLVIALVAFGLVYFISLHH